MNEALALDDDGRKQVLKTFEEIENVSYETLVQQKVSVLILRPL